MRAVDAVFKPAYMDSAILEKYLLPLEADPFAHSQTMPIEHQQQDCIAPTVCGACLHGSVQQPLNFAWSKVFTRANLTVFLSYGWLVLRLSHSSVAEMEGY